MLSCPKNKHPLKEEDDDSFDESLTTLIQAGWNVSSVHADAYPVLVKHVV